MASQKTSFENSSVHDASGNSFRRVVQTFFRLHGRMGLPWRKTVDPYKVVVSEVMLQQTQVSRVVEKYHEFLKAFPTVHNLAKAKLAAVLRVWSGLGYNRRAKYLHQMAQVVVRDYKGKFPKIAEELQRLPGIGHYTAGAVSAFAYNDAVPIIETNIRTVYIHHFFPKKKTVSDKELMKIIEKTLDRKNPREWYWALMDYGSYLKQSGINHTAKSKHYTKQATFAGSKRSVRGHILRVLTKGPATLAQLKKDQPKTDHNIEDILEDLVREGFIQKIKGKYSIP